MNYWLSAAFIKSFSPPNRYKAIILVALVFFITLTVRYYKANEIKKNSLKGTIMQTQELKIEDLTLGTGTEAINGKSVTVNYSGTLTNGSKFDSSYDRGTPFSFTLGAGEVIKGWDLGVVGMKVRGKRKLTIPSDLGYGSRGAGADIPPNATLVFEVELLEVN